MIKRLVRSGERVDLRTHDNLVSSQSRSVSALADCPESQAASREKRTGTFMGR